MTNIRPDRDSNLHGTPRLQALVDTNEPSAPARMKPEELHILSFEKDRGLFQS